MPNDLKKVTKHYWQNNVADGGPQPDLVGNADFIQVIIPPPIPRAAIPGDGFGVDQTYQRYLQCPHDSDLSPAGDFTIASFIDPKDFGGYNKTHVFGKGVPGGGSTLEYGLAVDGATGQAQFEIGVSVNPDGSTLDSLVTLPIDAL